MQVKVKALSNVAHGRFNLKRGQEFTLTKGESEELQKAGLVEIVGESDASEDAEQGAKMEVAPQNKMMPPAENKRDPEAEEVERRIDDTVSAYVESQVEQHSIVSGAETPEEAPATEEQEDSKPAAGRSGKKAPAKKAE